MGSVALDIVGQALFGTDLRGDADRIARALDILLPIFPTLIRPFGFALLRVPNPVRSALRRAGLSSTPWSSGLSRSAPPGLTPAGTTCSALSSRSATRRAGPCRASRCATRR